MGLPWKATITSPCLSPAFSAGDVFDDLIDEDAFVDLQLEGLGEIGVEGLQLDAEPAVVGQGDAAGERASEDEENQGSHDATFRGHGCRRGTRCS